MYKKYAQISSDLADFLPVKEKMANFRENPIYKTALEFLAKYPKLSAMYFAEAGVKKTQLFNALKNIVKYCSQKAEFFADKDQTNFVKYHTLLEKVLDICEEVGAA